MIVPLLRSRGGAALRFSRSTHDSTRGMLKGTFAYALALSNMNIGLEQLLQANVHVRFQAIRLLSDLSCLAVPR